MAPQDGDSYTPRAYWSNTRLALAVLAIVAAIVGVLIYGAFTDFSFL